MYNFVHESPNLSNPLRLTPPPPAKPPRPALPISAALDPRLLQNHVICSVGVQKYRNEERSILFTYILDILNTGRDVPKLKGDF